MSSPPSEETPLVVDLDGTLLKTDLLYESANQFLSVRPLHLFSLVAWLLQGRTYLKFRLAQSTDMDRLALPFNEPVVAWVRQQALRGRRIVLATATHRLQAEQVASQVGTFTEVLATENHTNLKGGAKRDLLVAKFGEKKFDYVGNGWEDLPVWQAAAKSYVVSDSPRLLAKVKEVSQGAEALGEPPRSGLRPLVQALRPHQWVKNVLVFVPLFTAHQYTSSASVLEALFAFVAFCLAASSVYVLNDLLDLPHDRLHSSKRHRPFASGAASLLSGWLLWPVLLALAATLAYLTLPLRFLLMLGIYFAGTSAYSLWLKRAALVDVLTLAALFTIRIIAGAVAISVPLSFWLLSFSLSFFLSLALLKRLSELKSAEASGQSELIGSRGYHPEDLLMLSCFGAASGFGSVLVLALYINGGHSAVLYHSPQIIWFVCPLLLYWICRAWLIAHRGEMHHDPVVFALTDKVSVLVAILVAGVFVLARTL